jgi:tRNA 2-selenouridine synthase
MKNQLQHTDLLALFLNDVPMLDVRAPIEYQQGAFPHTKNRAILDDNEREAIGLCYKEKGQDAAVALGEKLIQGDVKDQRIVQWQAFIEQYPDGVLYCFRGGMRSQITQMWIKEKTGVEYPRVAGGYKAMRRFLIESVERLVEKFDLIVLSGRTGAGKTRVLKHLTTSIDLEALANHRGSAFGATVTPQPTQINFETQLAIEMLKHEAKGHQSIVVEDEGRNIGSVNLPKALHDAMQTAKIVLLEVEDKDRVELTICEYADDMYQQMKQRYGKETAFVKLQDYLQGSLAKIQKRLGGERYHVLDKKLREAIDEHKKTGSSLLYADVFQPLLVDYYDPMYDYQISKKQQRIVHTGDRQNVLDYLQTMEF